MKARASFAAIFIVCAGATVADPTTFGTDLKERYTGIFRALDADNSGSLSKGEALASGLSQTSFQRLDHDGDKRVSLTEFLVLAEDVKPAVAVESEVSANPCRQATME